MSHTPWLRFAKKLSVSSCKQTRVCIHVELWEEKYTCRNPPWGGLFLYCSKLKSLIKQSWCELDSVPTPTPAPPPPLFVWMCRSKNPAGFYGGSFREASWETDEMCRETETQREVMSPSLFIWPKYIEITVPWKREFPDATELNICFLSFFSVAVRRNGRAGGLFFPPLFCVVGVSMLWS